MVRAFSCSVAGSDGAHGHSAHSVINRSSHASEVRNMWKIVTLFALAVLGVSIYIHSGRQVVEVPTLPDMYWGPEENKTTSTEIRPFAVNVPRTVIEDLHRRLRERRTFVQPLKGAAWTYGISTKYLEVILDYWQNGYNWTERQDFLNKYPQFVTNIRGLNIHYYHVRPSQIEKYQNVKVFPLLLVHGWPGSVVEFLKIIPMLTARRPGQNFVFEVIAPSLPGYGFSDGAVRPGLNPAQVSIIFKDLMERLNFTKFYLHGGDWGSVIITNLALLYPENTLGIHSTMCFSNTISTYLRIIAGSYFPSLVMDDDYNTRIYPLSDFISLLLEESGYAHIQGTKPDTIGTVLSASPVGLAAYILEKFNTWTNITYKERDDGGLLEKFTFDELLDNVMVYWITNSMTTSVRIYAEQASKTYFALKLDELPVKVPAACADFPNEILSMPKKLLGDRYPHLIQYNKFQRGGHFAAFEEPELLADDIYDFVKKTLIL